MNRIGIIGAMDIEVATLKEKMENKEIKEKAGMQFCAGVLHEKPVVIVQSGLGKVNAAICTQILVDDYQVDAVINTGAAGSLDAAIHIGDIVVSKDAVYHDMDATIFGYAKGQVPQMKNTSFPAHEGLILLAVQTCRTVCPEVQVFSGRVTTGEQFISEQPIKDRIKKDFDGLCTEMEGAAIAHAAWINKVPFVIIRAISDQADGKIVEYEIFEKEAAERSAKVVEGMIREL